MGRIKIKVPEILEARNLSHQDLMYGARIAINTAKRYADAEEADNIEMIDLDTIYAISKFLDVGIDDLLEIVDDE